MTTSEIQSNESSITTRLIELIKNMSEDEQRTLLKDLEECLYKPICHLLLGRRFR